MDSGPAERPRRAEPWRGGGADGADGGEGADGDHGADGGGEWRIDRRTFLAAGAAAALVGAAACSPASPTSRRGPLGAPRGVTVNGTAGAVGVDPDDVGFAWLVSDDRRGAI
jgi:hypothetical protein